MQYDVFISHSSCDKEEVALPLAQALQSRGLTVWLDKEQLHLGDSIRRGLDNAIRESRFGVVILSPAYLNSEWGQKELDAFFAKEKYQKKSILPIYHGLEVKDIEKLWPLLADKSSSSSEEGIDLLADKIQNTIKGTNYDNQVKLPFTKKNNWWPSNNWQWLIALGATGMLGLLPFTMAPQPTPITHKNSVTFMGDLTGNNMTINNIHFNKMEHELLFNSANNNSGVGQGSGTNKTNEDETDIEETLQKIQKSPPGELKKNLLRSLANTDPKKASELWRADLINREKTSVLNKKQMSSEWVDVGNIAYIFDSNQSLMDYRKAIELDPENIQAWNRVGLTQHRLGNINEAIRAYESILQLPEDKQYLQDSQISKAIAHGNLGLIYSSIGQLKEAEAYYFDALRIYDNWDRKNDIANQYNNIGLVYLDRKAEVSEKLEKAEEYFIEASEIYKITGNNAGLARVYNNLGSTYFSRNKNDDRDLAKGYFFKAEKINEKNKWRDELSKNYASIGLYYRELGGTKNLNLAEKYYLQSLKIEKELGRVEGIAIDEGNLGLIAQAFGDQKKACDHWSNSLELFNKIDSKDVNAMQDLLRKYCQ